MLERGECECGEWLRLDSRIICLLGKTTSTKTETHYTTPPHLLQATTKKQNKQLLTITLRAFRVDFLRAAFQLEFAKLIQNVEAGARKKQSACCQCRLFIVELLVQATKQQLSLRFIFYVSPCRGAKVAKTRKTEDFGNIIFQPSFCSFDQHSRKVKRNVRVLTCSCFGRMQRLLRRSLEIALGAKSQPTPHHLQFFRLFRGRHQFFGHYAVPSVAGH